MEKIKGRKIVCIFTGCEKSMNLEDLDLHESECDYKTVSCKYCKLELIKSKLIDHEEHCEVGKTTCDRCQTKENRDKHDCIKILVKEIQTLKSQIANQDNKYNNKLDIIESRWNDCERLIQLNEQQIRQLSEQCSQNLTVKLETAQKNSEIQPKLEVNLFKIKQDQSEINNNIININEAVNKMHSDQVDNEISDIVKLINQPTKTIITSSVIWSYLYIQINNNSSNIIVGTEGGDVLLYSIATGKLVRTFEKHEDIVRALVYLKNYKPNIFATGSFDCTCKIFELSMTNALQTIKNNSEINCLLSFGNLNKNFIFGDDDGTIQLYTFQNNNQAELKRQVEDLDSEITNLLLIEKHKYVVIGYLDGNICLRNASDLVKMKLFNKETSNIFCKSLIYYKDDMFITNDHKAKIIKIWSIHNNNSAFTFTLDSKVVTLNIYKDSDILITACEGQEINLFDLKSKELIKNFKADKPVKMMSTYKNLYHSLVKVNDTNIEIS